MPAQEMTLAQVFAIPDTRRPNGGTVGRFEKLKTRLAEEVKGIKWPTAMPDFVQKLGELLDISLPEVMISAWKKADEIEKTLEQSRTSPREPVHISLSEHTISSEFHPKIEVRLKGVLVKSLEFVVKLSLTLEGVTLGIQNGRIFEIETGSCVAGGTVEYGQLIIAHREFAPVALPGTIPIAAPAE